MANKLLLLLFGIFLVCNQVVFAQFSLAHDNTDNHVNVRGKGNKIIDKIPVGTIVWESTPDLDWSSGFDSLYVGYSRGDKIYFGNIHSSRIKNISKAFQQIQKIEGGDHIHFKNDSVDIIIKFKRMSGGGGGGG
ncbi:MAG: hypothetical protein LBD67_04205, partial [Candidatus Accumulibacter sp.]|nr:hypothetical protein [Accumulibacter sp.]